MKEFFLRVCFIEFLILYFIAFYENHWAIHVVAISQPVVQVDSRMGAFIIQQQIEN
jgi:hypothetical protein